MSTLTQDKHNLFANIPQDLSEEVFEDIVSSSNVRIERIISNGQTSPQSGWYDQEQNEWVIVIKGRAQLTVIDHATENQLFPNEKSLNEKVVDLQAGDYLNIPAHTKHKVSYTDTEQPTIWLAVFY